MAKRTAVFCLILLFLVCGLPGALAGETAAFSSLSTVKQDIQGSYPGASLAEGDRLAAKNGDLELYFNEASSIFKVKDLSNGYVWASGRQDETSAGLSRKWSGFARSLLSAEIIQLKNMTILTENPDFDRQKITYFNGGFLAEIYFSTAGIRAQLRVALQSDGLVLTVPAQSILHENGDYLLSKLYVAPFFGASHSGEGPGYMFIPDGCGALIRFGSAMQVSSGISMRVYGEELSIVGIGTTLAATGEQNVVERKQAYLPVLGFVHGAEQNAALLTVTGGEEYCSLYASPAGNIVDYFWAAPQFIYNETYNQPDNTGRGFVIRQAESNVVDARVKISFLNGQEAGYAGMARLYRQALLSQGALAEKAPNDTVMPVMVDCLMIESVKALADTQAVTMTTLADVQDWQGELAAKGIRGVLFSLRGTGPGGESRTPAADFSLSPRVGTREELARLARSAGEDGGRLLLSQALCAFYDRQLNGWDRVYNINRQYTSRPLTRYLDSAAYFMSLTKAERAAQELPGSGGIFSYALTGIGKYLLSSHRSSDAYTRTQARERTSALLAGLRERLDYIALNEPNAYALAFADAAYDIPVSNSQFIFETDSVPFLQIVLSGCIDAFAAPAVPGSGREDALLRMIDYNTYPHYVFTQRETTLLAKSDANIYYATSYRTLLPYMQEEYILLSAVLSFVRGKAILSRTVPVENVSVVAYEGGAEVIVNYSDQEYMCRGVSVPGRSARVILPEGAGKEGE